MRKSTKMFRLASTIGILSLPFVIISDKESFRNLWWIGFISTIMLGVFGIAFYAIRLEERGE